MIKRISTRTNCHDCGVVEGQIHEYGCDVERCPFCGHQLITCGCKYEALGYHYKPKKWINDRFVGHPTCGLPKDVYCNGLPKKEVNKWIKILEKKGRIPFIQYPLVCRKCGKLWPEMFKVSDEEWEKYIEPNMRNYILCKECYNLIKSWTDEFNKR